MAVPIPLRGDFIGVAVARLGEEDEGRPAGPTASGSCGDLWVAGFRIHIGHSTGSVCRVRGRHNDFSARPHRNAASRWH